MVYPEIVVAGCGNPLFADDGFGPAVAEELRKFELPENVMALDAGTSGPECIFPMLDPAVTKKLIVVDITDFGGEPGSLILFRLDDFRSGGIRDAHAGGIVEPLLTMKNEIDISIIGCQPKHVSDSVMEIGLSNEVLNAVPRTVRIILDLIGIEPGASIGSLTENYLNKFQNPAGIWGASNILHPQNYEMFSSCTMVPVDQLEMKKGASI